MRVRFAVAMILWCVLASGAAAEINGGDSVDWLVASADVIARCRVVEIVDDEPTSGHPWKRVTFEVTEAFKGDPAKRVVIRDSYFRTVERLSVLQKSGEEQIVFFQRTTPPDPADRNPHRDGLAKYPLRLTEPWSFLDHSGCSQGKPVAFTADFRVLRTPAEIEKELKAVIADDARPIVPAARSRGTRAWFSYPDPRSPGQPHSVRVDVTFEGDIMGELYMRSAIYLRLPLTTRTEKLAYEWFDRGKHLDAAMGVLRLCRSDRSIALFKSLLGSQRYYVYGYGGPGTRWEYYDRAVAYETLTAWDVDVPRPAIKMPVDDYVQLRWYAASGLMAVLLAVVLTARVIRRRCHRRQQGFGRATLDAVCVLLLIGGGVIGYAAWRNTSVPEATGEFANAQWWVWLFDRNVTLARAERWQLPQPLSAAVFDRSASPAYRWGLPNGMSTTEFNRLGFRATTGQLNAQISTPTYGGPGTPSAYFVLQLPLWAVLSAMLLLPAGRLVVAGRRVLRRRRRQRRGLCLACGYDLRGGQNRCPECGVAVAATSSGSASPAA